MRTPSRWEKFLYNWVRVSTGSLGLCWFIDPSLAWWPLPPVEFLLVSLFGGWVCDELMKIRDELFQIEEGDMDFDFEGIEENESVEVDTQVRMEWQNDEFRVLIFEDVVYQELSDAFAKGPQRYSYYEADGPVPVAIWSFEFPSPLRLVEVNFDACRLAGKDREALLAKADEQMTFHFMLYGDERLEAATMKIDPEALKAFFATLRKQLEQGYNNTEYNRYVESLFSFTPEEVFGMGQTFSPDVYRNKPELRLVDGGRGLQ